MEIEAYPPYPFLYQVASHCPTATSLYLDFWKKKDENSEIFVRYPEIAEHFCMSRTRFHNLTMNLCREGVVEWDKEETGFRIKVFDWIDFDEQK